MIYYKGVRRVMPGNNQEQLDLKRQKKIEIARVSGAKSCGPATPEGKSRSSQNARKDGRYAETRTRYGNHTIALANEDLDAHNEHLARHVNRFQPADPVELRILEDIAAIDWRIVRGSAVQTRLADREMEVQARALGPVAGSMSGTRCNSSAPGIRSLPHSRTCEKTSNSSNEPTKLLTRLQFCLKTNQERTKNEPRRNQERTENEPKTNRRRSPRRQSNMVAHALTVRAALPILAEPGGKFPEGTAGKPGGSRRSGS
jgi:hypothetical protein